MKERNVKEIKRTSDRLYIYKSPPSGVSTCQQRLGSASYIHPVGVLNNEIHSEHNKLMNPPAHDGPSEIPEAQPQPSKYISLNCNEPPFNRTLYFSSLVWIMGYYFINEEQFGLEIYLFLGERSSEKKTYPIFLRLASWSSLCFGFCEFL